MKIAILLNEQYPFGMACTNRTHIYAKGLAELGNDINILIPKPTELLENIRNFESKGVYEGVKFRYAKGSVKKRTFIGRRIQNALSYLNSFRFFFHYKPDIILIITNSFKQILLGKICSILLKIPLVREKTEVPFYNYEKLSVIQKTRIRFEFKLLNGLILISSQLKDFFQRDLLLHINIIEVPILIEASEENIQIENTINIKPKIVYTGSLSEQKDGVTIILKAFKKIYEKFPTASLIMTGDLSKSIDKENILKSINELNLKESVEFTGYISKQKLVELTSSATALILAKPQNRQNKYNMATKIGEYLLTGRPTVISSVDPISNYLTHKINAFIVEPKEDQIADQVEFILNNPAEANVIGLAGKEAAINFFDYKKHALRINDFFRSLQFFHK